MSINRTRAIVLGFLTLLAVGSFGATAALASPGPFWHHRAISGKGEGEKIEEKSPEYFQGAGGEQILKGTIAATPVEIVAKSVQAKGIIYNNSLQGQIKVLLKYHEVKLAKPALTGCEVKVGTNNEVTSEGHLMWKYRGNAKELSQEEPQEALGQKVDIVFTPIPLKEGATELPKGTFTSIALSGTPCGVLAGKFEVKESQSVIPKPSQLQEWSRNLVTIFPGWKEQHFWNGKEVVPVKNVGLTFGGGPATLTGSVESIADFQEIAVFEK